MWDGRSKWKRKKSVERTGRETLIVKKQHVLCNGSSVRKMGTCKKQRACNRGSARPVTILDEEQ